MSVQKPLQKVRVPGESLHPDDQHDETQIGSPDLLVLFTGTVSHKMVRCVLSECKNQDLQIARCHSSSLSALRGILEEHVG